MATSAFRLALRPIQGGLIWGGTGLGAGVVLPSLLFKAGWIYSTSLITTTACGGAIAVLLPLGMARGVASSLEQALIVDGRISQAMEQLSKQAASNGKMLVLENPTALWETMTLGSGLTGRLVRTIASPFLPSTAQMLTRMQQSVDAKETDSKVLAAAANGLVEGFLNDKKDTITTLGLLGYNAIIAIGLGVDYSYRRVDEGKKAVQEAAREKKEAAKKVLQDKRNQLEDARSRFDERKATIAADAKETKLAAKKLFQETKQKVKDLAERQHRTKEGQGEEMAPGDGVQAEQSAKSIFQERRQEVEDAWRSKWQKFKAPHQSEETKEFSKDDTK